MSRGQLNVWNSTTVQKYLTSRCMDDGGLPAWRYWDKDIDATKESATWQAALAVAKAETTQYPKIVVFAGSNPPKAYPLPTTEADALTILRLYGGN